MTLVLVEVAKNINSAMERFNQKIVNFEVPK